jgi:hypothetical protein
VRKALICIALLAFAMLAVPMAASAAQGGIKLKPSAGRFDPDTFKPQGNSTDAQAQWTNKQSHTGKFSVLLQKSVPTSEFAFAAATVDGVDGLTVAQLGNIGFSVNGPCGAGSPRFNLFYDNDFDGEADGVAFYGCANHPAGSTKPGWTDMLADASVPESQFPYGGKGPLTDASVVSSLSVVVDEQGTYYIDQVKAAGQVTGEPNGGV